MRLSTDTMRLGLRPLAALFERRSTLLGLAVVVAGSAAFGAVLPAAVPGVHSVSLSSDAGRTPIWRLPSDHLFSVLGKQLHSSTGAPIGQVAEVLVNGSGAPRAVVVNVGGFLGVGAKKVAVDWQALQFYSSAGQEVLVADLGPAQLAKAPSYDPAARSVPVVIPPAPQSGP